ncbi:MAG: hypothetical protein LLG08_03875, partial [Actinomycetia bacterium]|nr:hypothetical protein [Actinomycetes bacterium]
IARRENYAHVSDSPEAPRKGDEPSSEEVAESFARLVQAAETLPPTAPEVRDILAEMAKRTEGQP